jgi:hypothetical protein
MSHGGLFVRAMLVCLVVLAPLSATAQVTPSAPPTAPQPRIGIADASGPVTVRAVRIDRPIVLDGRLDEEAYTRNPSAGAFTQQEPNEGMPASEQTDVWIFFDNDNLYVSARCWDSQPSKIVANELRRDNLAIQNNDSFTVLLDTFHDRRNGYFIQTNPLGALRDLLVTDEANVNVDWNTVWDTKVLRGEQAWTVEMVIPFKSLRYEGGEDPTWGINFRRIVRSKNEISYLSPVPRAYGGSGVFKFSSAGTLVGLQPRRDSKNIELKPYAKTGSTRTPQTADDWDGDAGFDVKYGVTKSLTADFTVNTDFAQVEADEQQINLTRFSLFFPEKREFFLEGRGLFAFGGTGELPTGQTPNSELIPIIFFSRQIGLSNGREVPIRGGARLTGRIGRYTLGLVNIQTGASRAAGAVDSNFSIFRVRRDILRRSTIGLIGTYRPQRPGSLPGSNAVYGADAAFALFQNLTINTYYARSHSPDAASGSAASYFGRADYAGDRYGLYVDHLSVGRAFNPELGFMRRRSFKRSFAKGRFSPRPRGSEIVRKLALEGGLEYITDPEGRLETRESQGTFRFEFQNGDTWSHDGIRTYEFLAEPFPIATGVTVPAGGYDYQQYRTSYVLAPHHKASGTLSASLGSFYDGTRSEVGYNGRLDVWSRLAIEPRVSINWVSLPEGDFTARLTSARIGFTMTPRMAVSGLVQHTSSLKSLSSNVRFRWEYRPGSDLFVVYGDGRDTSRSGFPVLQDRTFAVKITRLVRW